MQLRGKIGIRTADFQPLDTRVLPGGRMDRSLPALGACPVLAATASAQPQSPITAEGRLRWFAVNTVGPASLADGFGSWEWRTLYNAPRGCGPHWEGFGNR